MGDKYWLGRSNLAPARLRLQYELTKTNFSGQLLDSSIAPDKSELRIADVCTGTGAWVLDLVEELPSSAQVDGLDINMNEIPPHSWLPPNTSFRLFDLLGEVPEELIEKYDIVNIQYVITFVLDHTIEKALTNLLRLLKPGGHLQWTDADNNSLRWPTASGDTSPPETVKLFEMNKTILGSSHRNWVARLPIYFSNAGLENVKLVKPEPRASTLQPMMLDWIWSFVEGYPVLAERQPEKKPAIDEWFKQCDKVWSEMKELQVGMDMAMTRCIGRKPSAG